MPLYGNDSKCIGMIFAGKPTKSVDTVVRNEVGNIVVIALVAMGVTALLCAGFANNILKIINKIKKFWNEMALGNLSAELDSEVLKREDEIGTMGELTLHVQKSLSFMVEYDALTKLYNRRTIEMKLAQLFADMKHEDCVFSVALIDIDFFKRINDTYGHECGDIVLIQIAKLLSEHMEAKGYAGRWGGEEFLLTYKDRNKQQTAEELDVLFSTIRDIVVPYADTQITVTITAGVAECDKENNTSIQQLIKTADNNLYIGKTSGRNRYIL
jgi:diguanylate cyclase (GGDEF)-like protein